MSSLISLTFPLKGGSFLKGKQERKTFGLLQKKEKENSGSTEWESMSLVQYTIQTIENANVRANLPPLIMDPHSLPPLMKSTT